MDKCQKKGLRLCEAEKHTVSPERVPLMGKQAGTKERTHQVSPVGQKDLLPLLVLFFLGGRGVLVKG